MFLFAGSKMVYNPVDGGVACFRDVLTAWSDHLSYQPAVWTCQTVYIGKEFAKLIAPGWPYLQLVPLAPGLAVKEHLLLMGPRMSAVKKHMGAMMECSAALLQVSIGNAGPQHVVVPRRSPRGVGAFAVELIIDHFDATRYLKGLHLAETCKRAWAKVLARNDQAAGDELVRQSRQVGYDVLLRGRWKLDVVWMLILRQWFQINMGLAHFFTCARTAPPQWRGVELFATSIDCVCRRSGEWVCYRYLLPVLRIGSQHLSLHGKLYALSWKFVLCVGPSYDSIRQLLTRVVSVTSDMGTERLFGNARDILPAFCNHVGVPIPPGTRAQQRLFPYAVQAPGWMHIFDTLIRRALCSMDWFPRWLGGIKAILTFLRQYSAEIVRKFKEAGFQAIAEIVQALSLPYFAQWRWGTLHKVCRSIGKAIGTSQKK